MGFKVRHPDNIIELAVVIVKAAANFIAIIGKIVVNMCEVKYIMLDIRPKRKSFNNGEITAILFDKTAK